MTTQSIDYGPSNVCYECGPDGDPAVGFSTCDEGKPICAWHVEQEAIASRGTCAYCASRAVSDDDELGTCSSPECRSWARADAYDAAREDRL